MLREQTQGMSLREIIELVLDAQRPDRALQGRARRRRPLENLEELVNAAESFVTQEGFGRDAVALPVDELRQSPASQGLDPNRPGSTRRQPLAPDAETGETLSPLAAFLTHAALESGDNQAQAGQDAVQLMTVHSAKGLEFDCVFITGLEEGLFPHENSMSDHESLEEERRLMYVAITRARKRLYLSHSQTRMLHGQTRYNVKSRFFDELPEARAQVADAEEPGLRASAFGYGGGYASTRGAGLQLDRRHRPLEPRRVAAAGAEARPRTACARACRCSTTSSAKAPCWRSKAAATMRARRSTSPATASSGWRCRSPS